MTTTTTEKPTTRDVCTIGQVARICNVSARTASKWFDSGALKGYRLPGGRDRRVTRKALLAFMRASGFPKEWQADV